MLCPTKPDESLARLQISVFARRRSRSLPLVGLIKQGGDAQQGGLPRSVVPEKRDKFSAADFEREFLKATSEPKAFFDAVE